MNPTLDLIIPLNETRPKEFLFKASYAFIEVDDHFISVFLHLSWIAIVTVYCIAIVDSLYILIIHHVCGLFDVCGYQIETATQDPELRYDQFKQCVMTHHKALMLFDNLQECSKNMFLVLVAINMTLISMTGVQILMAVGKPHEMLRFSLFFLCEHIHLYIISLFGQIILNHSAILAERIYSSDWYEIPIKFQKLLCIMILRCSKPVNLNAGGLYDMNMENYGKIKILLNFILNDWKILRDELPVLDRITEQGSRLAHMYRVTLMWATIGFIYIPLINPTLDLIIPLNETRPKEQLFGVCYVFINPDDYFTAVFLHMGWTTWVTVYNIITVDSLYILIIHHVCGLFDVCGYQIETIFKRSNLQHYQFKQCVIHHHKALEFFNYLQECSQNMNLMLVAITMILISTTAVQILMHMDQPLDSARFILFFVCSHIHLYIISLFGQIILNHSKTLAERIYSCNWYGIPIKFQKLLCIMILRCSKPAILSAGGLYDMNMENYGKAVKACMSYFTMFLSMRE
nr:PREDICTED: uncharacterized protein LOC100878875 isoform X1 [Megachile rotundata]